MKKMHVAGGALAGLLAVTAAFQTKNLQPNPVGAAPPATNTSTIAQQVTPGTGSPLPPGGAQAAGQFSFANNQDIQLYLRPDQTAYTELQIVYKAVEPKEKSSKEESGKEEKCPCAAKKKDGATTKKPATEKKGDTKTAKAPPANTPGNAGGAADQSRSLSSAPIPLKFNFDLRPFQEKSFDGKSLALSPCTATVSPLVADSFWELNGPARKIPVNITSCSPDGGVGQLTIANSSGEPRTLKVTLDCRKSPWLKRAILGSLALSVIVALICAVVVWVRGHKMRDQIGEASWDFSSSWASNITVFGTALTFLLSWAAFPDKPVYGAKLEYTFLAGFAGALVAIAPAIHRMMSVGIASSGGGSAKPAQGYVGGFLSASAFTIWGALLQIAISLLIVSELTEAVMIYGPIGKVVGVALGITGVGLIVYSFTTILATIHGTAERTGTPMKKILPHEEAAKEQPEKKMPIAVL